MGNEKDVFKFSSAHFCSFLLGIPNSHRFQLCCSQQEMQLHMRVLIGCVAVSPKLALAGTTKLPSTRQQKGVPLGPGRESSDPLTVRHNYGAVMGIDVQPGCHRDQAWRCTGATGTGGGGSLVTWLSPADGCLATPLLRTQVTVTKKDGSRGHHMNDYIPEAEMAKFMASVRRRWARRNAAPTARLPRRPETALWSQESRFEASRMLCEAAPLAEGEQQQYPRKSHQALSPRAVHAVAGMWQT